VVVDRAPRLAGDVAPEHGGSDADGRRAVVHDRAAVLCGVTVADGQAGKAHVAAVDEDFEDAVEPPHIRGSAGRRGSAVDERRAGPGPADFEAVGDVEVARGDVVLVQGRNGKLVDPAGDVDDVASGDRVRLLDRRS
jgi:hypothetical protein